MRKREILNLIFFKLSKYLGEKTEFKKVNEPRRKKFYEQIILSEEQKKKIDDFYLKNFGRKIPYMWHRLYQSYTGKFDEKYFPEFLYIPNFERKMNPISFANVFEDKEIVSFLPNGTDIKYPKTYVYCINGIITNENYKIISFEEMKELINQKLLFIKPRAETSSGEGCKIIEIENGIELRSNQKIEDFLEEYKNNFMIQECLKNHKILSDLYPNSINTFRVMTYIWNGKINYCPVILRIGQGGKNIDNAHAGGMFVGIKDNGELCSEAFTEFQTKYIKHPDTNIEFSKYKIPQITKIIEAAKKLHSRILQVGIVSWDLTLDENENVVMIESNIRGGGIWVIQMAHGCGVFGENTAEILQFLANKNIIAKEI